MHIYLMVLVVSFTSMSARAFTLEPSVSFSPINTYTVSNINAEYDLTGVMVRLEGLFDIGMPMPMDVTRYFWGGGLGYGSFEGDLTDAALASATLSVTGNFDVLVPYLVLGMGISDFTFKLSATPFMQINEKGGVSDGDEKYGMGGGIDVGYKVFQYLSLNVGYHYFSCGKGKNSSTGESGSLANDVDLKFVTAGVSFPFSFSSMGGGSENRFRRPSRGRAR